MQTRVLDEMFLWIKIFEDFVLNQESRRRNQLIYSNGSVAASSLKHLNLIGVVIVGFVLEVLVVFE